MMSEEYFPYIMVIVESQNVWSHLSKRVWCVNHGIDNFYVRTTVTTDAWFFKDEQDALAFKLRYSGESCTE